MAHALVGGAGCGPNLLLVLEQHCWSEWSCVSLHQLGTQEKLS